MTDKPKKLDIIMRIGSFVLNLGRKPSNFEMRRRKPVTLAHDVDKFTLNHHNRHIII